MIFSFRILFGFAFFILLSACNEEHKKPNVILIITDDQGYGDMSCHGNPYIKTPAIDEIYNSSVVFNNFHVDPTCAPTRAALMTGKYATKVGVWMTYMGRHHLNREEVTMAKVFAENGYKTAIFGKWHLGDNYPFRPSDRGFQESLVHGGGVIGETPDYWGNNYYDDIYLRNDQPEKQEGYCTDVWFTEAKAFIKKNKNSPFFLYLATNAPHGPLKVPYKYVAPFIGKKGISEERAWFYGMIKNIDENIAELRGFLEKERLSENTLLVFMSDNGTRHGYSPQNNTGYNAGMRATKGSPFEGGHRVPCMMYWPAGGLDQHRQIKQLTAHFDIFPTLLDLLDLQLNHNIDFDGTSLLPLIKASNDNWEDRTLFVHNQISFGQKLENDLPIKYKKFAVMENQWRLVGNELFDINEDPGQQKNIAEENPVVVKRLQNSYDAWWEKLTPVFKEYNSVVVGSNYQKEVVLSSQFWHGDYVPYSQQHVRNGMKANGFWDVDVATSGYYIITLRRWPRELNLSMHAILPKTVTDTTRSFKGDKHEQLPSRAIDVQQARLQIDEFDKTVPVSSEQKEISFKVALTKGKHFLKSWLIDAKGDSTGAYYVYVEPV